MQHYLTHKRTRDNYLMWRAQFLPYLNGHHLHGHVDGTLLCPDPMVIPAPSIGRVESSDGWARYCGEKIEDVCLYCSNTIKSFEIWKC